MWNELTKFPQRQRLKTFALFELIDGLATLGRCTPIRLTVKSATRSLYQTGNWKRVLSASGNEKGTGDVPRTLKRLPADLKTSLEGVNEALAFVPDPELSSSATMPKESSNCNCGSPSVAP